MRKIIYQRPDSGVSVVTPAFNLDDPEGWTDADSEQRAWNKLPPDAINAKFIDSTIIPTDRTFRSAWTFDGVSISVDLTKAKAIATERLQLAAYDAALAAEKNKAAATVNLSAINSAQSTDELRALL